MLPENVQLWHQDEERCRARSLEFIEQNQALAEHLAFIHDAMYVLVHFGREHRHHDTDEFTMQLLGVRMLNTVASALKLVLSGYHQPALQLLRDLQETVNLLDYFLIEPGKIAEWRVADDKGQKAFNPVKIRLALEKHSHAAGAGRDVAYRRLSIYGAHPTYRGFGLIADNGEIKAGPLAHARRLGDWLLETACWLGHGALTFSEHLQSLTPELQAEKTVLVSAARAWHAKYLAAPAKS
jgi:hypothetical protein